MPSFNISVFHIQVSKPNVNYKYFHNPEYYAARGYKGQ